MDVINLLTFRTHLLPQRASATQRSETSLTGKMLHTVTCSEGSSKRTLTFDTLLESIEKARAGDRLLPGFQATVLRVFRQQLEAGSSR